MAVVPLVTVAGKGLRVSSALAPSRRVAIEMAARVTKRQVAALIEEIEAYLRAVDVFRSEGYEPHWRLDPDPARP